MRVFILFFSLLFLGISTVQAADQTNSSVINEMHRDADWQLLQQRWKKSQYLSSQFIQSRYLAVLSRPLVSEGNFYYHQDQGICWSMKKPWEQWFVITPDAIIQGEGSGETSKMLGKEQPMFSVFSKAFFALFTGDIFAMEKWFDMSLVINESAWTITLSPKDEAVAILANKMELTGDNHLQVVTLFDANDDKTEIHFLNVSNIKQPVSDDEKHCYSQ